LTAGLSADTRKSRAEKSLDHELGQFAALFEPKFFSHPLQALISPVLLPDAQLNNSMPW